MTLPVRAFVDPALGLAGPPLEFARPDRATLADIIALVPLENEAVRRLLRVKLGGEIIDPALYDRVLPKADTFLTVVLPVGDKNLLGTIAAVALIGASLFVGGGFAAPFLGSAFASGAIGASLVSGGLSLGASLLLQGLNAPQTAAPDSGAKQVGVASAQNSFEPGAYLQRVMGTRKVFPQMVMPPYTELDNDDQIVTAVYGLAGPHALADPKLAGASIADADDVEYEIRQGFADDDALTLVSDTRVETGVNLKLSQFRVLANTDRGNTLDTSASPYVPSWHRLESKPAPDRFTVFVSFDQGLLYIRDDSGTGPSPAVTALRLRLRRKGTSYWYNLPELVVRGQKASGAMRLQVDFQWLATADMPGSVTAFAATYGGFSWLFQSVTNGGTTYWSADSYFATNKVDHVSDRWIKVYLDTASFPQDAYEIEVRRGQTIHDGKFGVDSSTAYHLNTPPGHSSIYDLFGYVLDGSGNAELGYAQDAYSHQISIPAAQSVWDEYPFDFTDQPTALIAIRARNRSIDQFSCLASGYTEDWNGSSWVADRATSNPAAWYREALRSDFNAEPVADSLVDMSELQDWWQDCFDNHLEVNAVIQGQPVTDVLSICAQAGLARPRYGATYGAIFDGTKSPVGLVTQRNASGFSFQKPFGRLPHALKVNLADEANDYEVREIIVYDDGYAAVAGGGLLEATRFESVTYPGITAELQAIERATRDLRFGRNRSKLLNFSMDIEHLEFGLGDLLYLETDILGQTGGRGRVKSIQTSGGLITSLTFDEERDFTAADDAAASRGIAIRQVNGTVLTKQVTSNDSDLTRVYFTTPFAMPVSGGTNQIVPGSLVATGTFGSEARRVLLWGISPGPDLTAQITAIDYAEADMFDHLLWPDGGHILWEDGGFIDDEIGAYGDRWLWPEGIALRWDDGGYILME